MRLVGLVKALSGAPGEALAIWDQQSLSIGDYPRRRLEHAWILALAGRRKEALQALDEHKAAQTKKNIDIAFDEACVYAGLGEKDKAFEWLFKSYENHSSGISHLVADWCLHSLHGDHRFEELARKISSRSFRVRKKPPRSSSLLSFLKGRKPRSGGPDK